MSLNTTRRAKRSAIVAATALSSVIITGIPAVATPDQPAQPGNTSDAIQKLRALSQQAEAVTEDYKKAQDDHQAKQADLARFTAMATQADQAAAAAKAQEEQLRGQVDKLTKASYEGSRLNTMSALVGSDRPQEFLDRASTIDLMSRRNDAAVRALADATHRAEAAQKQARDAQAKAAQAEQDAARIEADMAKRKQDMDAQVAQVKQQYASLSSSDKSLLSGLKSAVGQLAGTGVAIKAVNAALSKQGSPYVFGAKGPNSFDCSGLVQWAYAQAGVQLPASTKGQVKVGVPVSKSEMKPGDLIFFYDGPSHVGIYIGGGKMVHAPTEGEDVMVETVAYMGQINSIRRVAG